MDFKYATIVDMQYRLDRHINPFTGLNFSDDEESIVTDMMRIIYAAVHNEAVEFDPVYVEIPILELRIQVKEETTIKPFSQKISDAIARVLEKRTFNFSQENIQDKFHWFLTNCDLIEFRVKERHFYATKKGEKCGLINKTIITKSGEKWHSLVFNAYMQVYLLRLFPEIFIDAVKFEFKKTVETDLLVLKTEPLTLKEQDLILKYRAMNKQNKQLLEDAANDFLEKQ